MEIYPSFVGGGLLPRCDRYAFAAPTSAGFSRPQRPPYKLGALRRTYKETKPP